MLSTRPWHPENLGAMARNLVVFSWVGLLLGMNPYPRRPKSLLLLTYEGIRPTFVSIACGERISRERIVISFGIPISDHVTVKLVAVAVTAPVCEQDSPGSQNCPGSVKGEVRGRERKFHHVLGTNKVRPTLYVRICGRSGIPRPNQRVNGGGAAAAVTACGVFFLTTT